MEVKEVILVDRVVKINKNNQLHCNDGPAVIWDDGTKEYWLDGLRCVDLDDVWERIEDCCSRPLKNGHYFDVDNWEVWVQDHKRHREDGPAVIEMDGKERFFLHNVEYFIQEDYNKALISLKLGCLDNGHYFDKSGNEVYVQNGVYHREDGPAIIEPDGTQKRYANGVIYQDSRLPVVIKPDGTKIWEFNSKIYTDEEEYYKGLDNFWATKKE